MSPTLHALLGYVAWTLLLVTAIGIQRSVLTLGGKRAANSFSTTGEDVSPFSARLCRAHANCYESFPWLGGAMIVAVLAGQTAITDPLARWALVARIGQSVVHIASTSVPAVTVRFTFFVVQIGIVLWWIVRLAAM